MAEKTLVLCYSLTGKTMAACKNLARFAPGKLVMLERISRDTLFYAYTAGLRKACKRAAADILPVAEDISDYRQIVVAGPVWGGFPAPALYDFLREYEIGGKVIHGLLTYGRNPGGAPSVLQEEIAAAGAVCGSVVTIKSDARALSKLKDQSVQLYLDGQRGISLRKG